MTPDTRARLVLLTLPKMGPARLTWLLAAAEAPAVVEDLRRGRLPAEAGEPPAGVNRTIIAEWLTAVRNADSTVERVLNANQALGVTVVSPLEPDWPLADDPEPPGLLFTLGDLDLFRERTRVAVVGTRRCTAIGRAVAHGLGSDL
ncbi:MAG: DNA-processing protein DprA, partial [Actinomycetota bacterium]